MTHPIERGRRKALSVVLHKCTHTHTARNDSYITGSERGPCGSTHLPKTDVKNKSERSSD